MIDLIHGMNLRVGVEGCAYVTIVFIFDGFDETLSRPALWELVISFFTVEVDIG